MEITEKDVKQLKKDVGRRVRSARTRAGFRSADSAAEAMEISPTALYELERGDNWISPEMVLKLVATFKIDAGILFTDDVVRIEPTPQEALSIVAQAIGGKLPPLFTDQEKPMEKPVQMQAELERAQKEIQRLTEKVEELETLIREGHHMASRYARLGSDGKAQVEALFKVLTTPSSDRGSASKVPKRP